MSRVVAPGAALRRVPAVTRRTSADGDTGEA